MHGARQRLDLWIWHARLVRTRADARALIEAGRVRVNAERKTTPGHGLKRGDSVTLALDGRVRIVQVVDFVERRGDARLAVTTYADIRDQQGGV
jgi:ribosome-associated heat shock protein Hsp15